MYILFSSLYMARTTDRGTFDINIIVTRHQAHISMFISTPRRWPTTSLLKWLLDTFQPGETQACDSYYNDTLPGNTLRIDQARFGPPSEPPFENCDNHRAWRCEIYQSVLPCDGRTAPHLLLTDLRIKFALYKSQMVFTTALIVLLIGLRNRV